MSAASRSLPVESSIWQKYRLAQLLLASALFLALSIAALDTLGNSLLDWKFRLTVLPVRMTIVTLLLMLPVTIWVALSQGILRWLSPKRIGTAWVIAGWPAAALVACALCLVLFQTLPGLERQRFEKITALPWPAGARLVYERHTLFMDHKHIWVFASSPGILQCFITDGPWRPRDGDLAAATVPFPTFPRAVQAGLSGALTADWGPAQLWTWEADKNAVEGPFGPAFVVSDANTDQLRWCLWWDGY